MNTTPTQKRYLQPFFLFSLMTVAITVVAIFLLATTPPISRDALTHHLYVPKLWLQQGSIAPLDHIVFSYYPMNLDLLYTIPLYFGNDIIPKYIHFFFALLTGWMIYGYLANRLSKAWGVFGALFFLSIPIIVKLSITAYVDLGLVAFSTASLLLLFKWSESNKLHHLAFAGICCGIAAGTKYNGLICIFLFTLLTPIIFSRTRAKDRKNLTLKPILMAIIFAAFTLASLSPWLIRNYKLTGNPVYPLYNSLFQEKSIPKTSVTTRDIANPSNNLGTIAKKLTNRRGSSFANRKERYQETWWQALLLPIRFFIEGRDDDPRYFDGKLNPFLLIFMFFAFYHYRYSRQTRLEQYFLFSFGWLFFFLTFFQEALRIRYIAVAIPPFVILATFGIHNIFNRLQSREHKKYLWDCLILFALILPLLGYNGQYLISQIIQLKPYSFISGKVSREEYISHFRPEYPIQQFANNSLKQGDKILALYVGRRGYYFDYPVIFDNRNDKDSFWSIVKKSESGNMIRNKLQLLGFSHLVIRLELFKEMANILLSREKISLLDKFLAQHTKQLANNSQYGLFELRIER